MPTPGSREQDGIARRATRDQKDSVEHERNRARPCGPDTHGGGSIGGGDSKGRQGKVYRGDQGRRTSSDQ